MLDELIKSGIEEIQIIIFTLGSEDFGVPISHVQEVIIPSGYTRIPKAPEYVSGVINLRGNIIPVFDGKKKFGIKITEKDKNIKTKRVMIMNLGEETAGLIVDSVSEVAKIKVCEIEPPPVNLGENNEIFWGITKFDEKLIVLIDSFKCVSMEAVKKSKKLTELTDTAKKSLVLTKLSQE